jgi:hypothetical protein
VKEILTYDPVLQEFLRGDDSGWVTRTAVELYLLRICYAAINSVGNDAKMGISQNICEFLRNEISVDGVRGWTNRSIPTITQRKPWNPQPWSPSAEITTIANNIYLLGRRSQIDMAPLHQIAKLKWSHHTKQSVNWLSLPVRLGGFGLYPYQGWVPNRKLPLVTKPLMEVTNLVPLKPYPWIELSPQQLETVHQVSMTNKISAADIVGPQKYFAREYVNRVRNLGIKWTKTPVTKILPKPYPNEPGITEFPNWPENKTKFIASNNSKVPDLTKFLREYDLVQKASQYNNTIKSEVRTLKQYLAQFFPAVSDELILYERKGWHRTDALNLIMGDMPIEPVKSLHPILALFVKDSLKHSKYRNWVGRNNIAYNIYTETTASVDYLTNSVTNKLYMW